MLLSQLGLDLLVLGLFRLSSLEILLVLSSLVILDFLDFGILFLVEVLDLVLRVSQFFLGLKLLGGCFLLEGFVLLLELSLVGGVLGLLSNGLDFLGALLLLVSILDSSSAVRDLDLEFVLLGGELLVDDLGLEGHLSLGGARLALSDTVGWRLGVDVGALVGGLPHLGLLSSSQGLSDLLASSKSEFLGFSSGNFDLMVLVVGLELILVDSLLLHAEASLLGSWDWVNETKSFLVALVIFLVLNLESNPVSGVDSLLDLPVLRNLSGSSRRIFSTIEEVVSLGAVAVLTAISTESTPLNWLDRFRLAEALLQGTIIDIAKDLVRARSEPARSLNSGVLE